MAIASSSVSKRNCLSDQKGKIRNGDKTKEDKSRKQSDDRCDFPAKRSKCPGVRVVGGRIYDSEHGKTCHQCRQKTMDFVASCKNQKNGKPCTINFCHKCLLNRYGEKAEEVAILECWNCPKCRGICNCSFCMKKRGHQPTGILVHTAKATGFSSVSELLDVQGSESLGVDKIVKPEPKRRGKENAFSGNSDSNSSSIALPSTPNKRTLKRKNQKGLKEMNSDSNSSSIALPSSPNKRTLRRKNQKGLKEMENSNHDEGIFMSEPSYIMPQISNQRLKTTLDSKQSDGVFGKGGSKDIKIVKQREISLKVTETKNSPISKKVFTEIQDSTGPTGHNGVLTKEVKISGDVSVPEKEKNDVSDSNGVSFKLLGCKKREKQRESRTFKVKTDAMKLQDRDIEADIPMPQGAELTTVAGIDLPPGDIGHALQFLEFCATFKEILDLKEGDPALVLGDLMHGRFGRRKPSPVVQFHIQLLLLIQEDLGEDSEAITHRSGKNSWLHALQNCATKSQCVLRKLKFDSLGRKADDYNSLDSSQRLVLLVFLCDEVLCTAHIRSWIDDQNLKTVQKVKETKERVLAGKKKEKQLKQKMLDEVAKTIIGKNGAPLSISEHEAVVSQIKAEVAQAHAEIMESQDMVPNDIKRCAAVRTGPILLDINGHTYWRLNGYSDDSNVLLQDVGTWDDDVESGEKWFTFDVEQEKQIDRYVSSRRKRKLRSQRSQKVTDGPSSKNLAKVDLVL